MFRPIALKAPQIITSERFNRFDDGWILLEYGFTNPSPKFLPVKSIELSITLAYWFAINYEWFHEVNSVGWI